MQELVSIGIRPVLFVPLIVVAVLALAGIPLLVKGYRIRAKASGYLKEFEGDGWRMAGWFITGSAACVAIVLILMCIPFQSKYYQLYRVSGEVTKVSNVLVDASGSLTGSPIVELDTLPVSVALDNERAVNLEGKAVTLTCTVSWRYASADRVVCDLYEVTP
ncbi:hypothetical protein BLJ79_21445 [Arthrobacter sp. UCD-GKA]|uniref:hypothetical protein n=1 Tax=Arthrobacter sp. UCD-GKA TaxID=1913576 RepID=UPI0008DD0A60|nr:hypothetical protein [Arthrobacter sp. UCD-GKA]OIH81928.1 hypothetical protein BLJ79_21445 [Arthrobacter sp. UCD-GKA]